MGRPTKGDQRRQRYTLRMEPWLYEAAGLAADADQVSLADWLHAAVTAKVGQYECACCGMSLAAFGEGQQHRHDDPP